ncbi:MAG TPA: hypothetical protein GXX54_07595 [Clostridiales bacterium]|nr:hypothetical protein [Clostridiales bacterium]
MGITQQAKNLLKGQWIIAVSVECIRFAAWLVIAFFYLSALTAFSLNPDSVVHVSGIMNGGWLYPVITVFFLILDLLLVSPVLMGRMSFYYKIATGENPTLKEVFKYFGIGRYSKALRWRFFTGIYKLFDLLVCLSPAAVAGGIAKSARQGGGFTPQGDFLMLMGNVSCVFLLIMGLIVYAIISQRRLLPVFLMVSEDEMPKKPFLSSSRKMRGNLTNMFIFNLSFSGRLLSCILVIPMFYVMPLYMTSKTLAAIGIMSENREKQPSAIKPVSQDTLEIPNF